MILSQAILRESRAHRPSKVRSSTSYSPNYSARSYLVPNDMKNSPSKISLTQNIFMRASMRKFSSNYEESDLTSLFHSMKPTCDRLFPRSIHQDLTLQSIYQFPEFDDQFCMRLHKYVHAYARFRVDP